MKPKLRLEKLVETEVAWETHASGAKFYGIGLADYKARVQQSRDTRALIANLQQQLTAATNERNRIDKENLDFEMKVVKGIAGDKDFGDDSALYKGTGRVPKSERKSGLTRRKKNVDSKSV